MKKHTSIPFTKQGYQQLLTEQESLQHQRPAAVAELARAREMGDLSENGAYKGARFKLSHIDRRLRELTHLIRNARVVESIGTDRIDIGSVVVVSSGEEEQTFRIVGSFESNPSQGTISHVSPIGKALIGKTIGDIVEVTIPKGVITYTIVRIVT